MDRLGDIGLLKRFYASGIEIADNPHTTSQAFLQMAIILR